VEAEEGRATDGDGDVGFGKLPRADLIRVLHAREQLSLTLAEVAGKASTDLLVRAARRLRYSLNMAERAAVAAGCASVRTALTQPDPPVAPIDSCITSPRTLRLEI